MFSHNHVQLVSSSKPIIFDTTNNTYTPEGCQFELDANQIAPYMVETKSGDRQECTIVTYDFETDLNLKKLNMIQQACVCYYFNNELRLGFGENCGSRMVEYVHNNTHQPVKWVAYNGQNFDNYLLLNSVSQCKKEININSLFLKENQLISLDFGGRHSVFDPCPFTLASLKNVS